MDQIDISQEMAAPEVQPSVSGHPQLDIARDEIPAFGTLQAARPGVYETNRSYDTFSRTVEAMSTAGEEGRRRGLGFWMLGRYDEAADALKSYTDDDVAMYTCGRSLVSAARPGEAVALFEALSVKYPDEPRPKGDMLDAKLDADLVAGDVEAAITNLEASLAAQREPFHESAEGRHLRGRISALSGEYHDALEHFQAARAADPSHRRNLFHLAYLSERVGQEALALDAYETLATMLPVDRAVMINLGVLYEDLGRDQDAAACYDTIARTDPTDRFARLYLEDAKAGMSMYYDEDLEKKEDRLNQILRIPITDFELSVRARNCLNKMAIMTLGDLAMKTEAELRSFKNFGDASLDEISWGTWEGKAATAEMHGEYLALLDAWRAGDYQHALPEADSALDMQQRLQPFVAYLKEAHQAGIRQLLVCSHGGALGFAVALLKGDPLSAVPEYKHHNTGLTIFEYDGAAFHLLAYNHTEHLTALRQADH